MKKDLKLPGPNSVNVLYGRRMYNRAIHIQFNQCVDALNDMRNINSKGEKFFTARLLKNRFNTFCKEIMDDFRARYKSPNDSNRLNDVIMEKSIMLDNLIAVTML